MAAEVVMPRLGWTMETGSIVEWLKRDGEVVQAGELLFSIESDKAVNEVEALDSGVLRIPPDSPALGQAVPIGTLLAYLVAPGERVPFEGAGPATTLAPASQASTLGAAMAAVVAGPPGAAMTTVVAGPPSAAGNGPPAISPRARRVAAELGLDWTGLTGSGRSGRIVERDVRQAADQAAHLAPSATAPSPPRVSPLARRMAEQAGVDVAALAPACGRVTRAAVAAAASDPPAAPAVATPAPAGVPFAGIRRLIATRLVESAHTVAPVTLTTEADASRLVRLREEITADLTGAPLAIPTYTDLLIRLTAVALTEHPALNVSLEGDLIVQHPGVHIGLAVETERGLLVPVVRDAGGKSLQRTASETARLIAASRDGSIGPDDLRGGTFTITNLGMYEIDAFTPIINLPECAILGVGRLVARPVVVDVATETIAVRTMVALSLTFDHRLVDGAPAARFLQRIKHLIERPTLWLTR